jgi:protein phosphatase
MITVRSAGLSDIGRRRSRNEDALLRDDSRLLYIVADGMGGHRAG